ncbi:hypothetical protein JRT77AECX_JRT77AEC_01281 [Escherichia coli]|nr:hypothetical protein JRT77AECX_JRT77AEC_01281 [Escherichia coli]
MLNERYQDYDATADGATGSSMNRLLLVVLALLLAALGWQTWRLADASQTISTQADELQSKSQALAKSNSQLISLSILTETNNREQARLYADAEQTSALLRQRQHRIEELKRENEDLRRWADTPLPADIIRLRERPTLTGGAAYRQWLQVPLRDLWNPATCPVSFLPYLAWAFSVDRWDEGWTESVKRQVVKDAFYIHQHKGTTSAVRRVVEPFGFLIRIIEWWQTGETPGTFRLDIGVQDQGITEDTYLELERLISDAKPCSRHMIGMSINLQTSGPHWVGAASYLGEEITIYPYINETIISGGTAHEGGAVHVIDTMRVNP